MGKIKGKKKLDKATKANKNILQKKRNQLCSDWITKTAFSAML